MSESSEAESAISLFAKLPSNYSYAAWQNSIPLLRSLTVRNETSDSYDDLKVELTSDPPFLREKKWTLKRVVAGDKITVEDRDIDLDVSYLGGLSEAERGQIRIRVVVANGTLAESVSEIRLLARDEWGGSGISPELLAAFVLPNDPAVAKVLKGAADVLQQHGKSPSLEGYQSEDPARVWTLLSAIWASVASLDITYASPPTSFEKTGQKTRTPGTILQQGLSTCLDTSLLFASAVEAAGLNPVIIMTKGHCFAGAWLKDKLHGKLAEKDSSEIRKAIDANELVTFETTLATQPSPSRFETAVERAKEQTTLEKESEFVIAIDVARARMAQIKPLASHSAPKEQPNDSEAQSPKKQKTLGLSDPPPLSNLPVDTVEQLPSTPSGRIDRWQRRLLDLTLRNRLLNFRSTKQTIPVVCPEIEKLEDLLADEKRLRLISLPEQNPIGQRDEKLHEQKTNVDLNREFAAKALQRKEVSCDLPLDELEKRLIKIYRAVRNDMSEGGTNTLFLAVGFLRWRRTDNDKKTYRAPILLVPVKLTRKSSKSPFYLRAFEDETRFNSTLIQLLKQDFGKDISGFESSLSTDDSGIDVPKLLQQVRHYVREIAGFEVIDECAVGRFSFSKYLLWKDLVDRTDQLKENRVVRHLLDNPEEVFESGSGEIPEPGDIDRQFNPAEIFHPLHADSSQLAAIMASSEGKDFVLIGPPGTGKSQTIANIVAQCLATKKSVLFVAEKTAALEVVFRRLKKVGLGDCCVELHSKKAQRREFLQQMEDNWLNNRDVDGNDWVEVSKQLKLKRDELNEYVETLHRPLSNGWTPFEAFGIAAKAGESANVDFPWEDSVQHDEARYQQFESTVDDMATAYKTISGRPALAIDHTDWSMGWEKKLLDQIEDFKPKAKDLRNKLSAFSSSVGLEKVTDATREQVLDLLELSNSLIDCENASLAVDADFEELATEATAKISALKKRDTAKSSMLASFENSLDHLPLDQLDLQWREAISRWWPFSWFAKRKVRKLLQTYADPGSSHSDPETDLPALRAIIDSQKSLSEGSLVTILEAWKGVDSNLSELESELSKASRLRGAIEKCGEAHEATQNLTDSIARISNNRAEIVGAASSFNDSWSTFETANRDFASLSGRSPALPADRICESTTESLDHIVENRKRLKPWTSWCAARASAIGLGLEPIASMLGESSTPEELPGKFREAYANWLLPKMVDGSAILRKFSKTDHEKAIRTFCKLDGDKRELAPGHARHIAAHGLPAPEGVPKKSELGLLRHQMQLKRPSKSIRDVVTAMPDSFRKLAPCLLMSPLSIAQYLPADMEPFDIVIFDEASQIPTWDAIGAIARGKQTVIVGDPNQLPPTSFFDKADEEEFDDELESDQRDLESILDEAKASGLPTLQLNWHYRSRHESLIAFSNYSYYGNRLITFHAADDRDLGVSMVKVADAFYDLGKSRTNRKEADAIVADAVERMKGNLELSEDDRRTFGVVTFNMQQQELIQDLFEDARIKNPEIEWYFDEARIEPTVVKNLENVQGDERDVMYFSITFGPTESNPQISLNFGALNREGGHRRLNVAVTRSRQQMIVYTSFSPEQLDSERSKSRGLNDLKKFLQFAETGGTQPLGSFAEGSVGGFDSPFEEAVAEALQNKGWQIVPQVGVSGFRIDIGIQHPDKPGVFLAGVECDGATYHRSAVARDRDLTRQLVLEGLGWNMFRVWSPDWWYDAAEVTKNLDEGLIALLGADRAEEEEHKAQIERNQEGADVERVEPTDDISLEQIEGDIDSMAPVTGQPENESPDAEEPNESSPES